MGRKLRQYRGAKALPKLIQTIAKEVLPEEGHVLAHVMLAWPQIVGEAFQDVSLPDKITRHPHTKKTQLRIIISSASSAFLMRYQEAQMRERLLAYFGEHAIEKITFKYGELPPKPRRFQDIEQSVVTTPTANDSLSADEKLALALANLKKSLK